MNNQKSFFQSPLFLTCFVLVFLFLVLPIVSFVGCAGCTTCVAAIGANSIDERAEQERIRQEAAAQYDAEIKGPDKL